MAGNPRAITIKGPWKGMEMDVSRQTNQHDEVSINVDYYRGRKEPRPGFVFQATTNKANELGLAEDDYGNQWVFALSGVRGGVARSKLHVVAGVNGTFLGDEWDATDATEPEPDIDGTVQTIFLLKNGRSVRHGLISTRHSSYVFDFEEALQIADSGASILTRPLRTLSTEKTSSGGDALRNYDLNYKYWKTPPHGSIACEHQSRVYYSGFVNNDEAWLWAQVPANSGKPLLESILDPSRSRIPLGPHCIVYSDEYDPAGVQAQHIFSVPNREKVTGLKSWRDQLIIWTDKSVYVMTGGSDDTFNIQKSVSGTGCISSNSIIEVNGILYWAAFDGIYGWQGPGTSPTPISKSLDPIFNRNHNVSFVPETVKTALDAMKWPLRVDTSRLKDIHSVYSRSKDQIRWSVPMEGWSGGGATLCFDLNYQCWSIWLPNPDALTYGLMEAGVSYVYQGVEHVYTLSNGKILKQDGDWDCFDGSTLWGVPVIWYTPRINPDNEITCTYRPVWLKCLTTGSTEFVSVSRVFMSGERSHWDYGEDSRQEVYANIEPLPGSGSAYNHSFSPESTIDGTAFTGTDWHKQVVELDVKSDSVRIGVYDDPGQQTSETTNRLQVQSFGVNVSSEGPALRKSP